MARHVRVSDFVAEWMKGRTANKIQPEKVLTVWDGGERQQL